MTSSWIVILENALLSGVGFVCTKANFERIMSLIT